MAELQIGDPAPSFTLNDQSGEMDGHTEEVLKAIKEAGQGAKKA